MAILSTFMIVIHVIFYFAVIKQAYVDIDDQGDTYLSQVNQHVLPCLIVAYLIGIMSYWSLLKLQLMPIQSKNIGGPERRDKCEICGVIKRPDIVHCSDCNVCIEGYDHHCGVVGVCVGDCNFKYFCMF